MEGSRTSARIAALAVIVLACTGSASASAAPRQLLPAVQDLLPGASVDTTPSALTAPITVAGKALSPFGTVLGEGAGPEVRQLLIGPEVVAGVPTTLTVSASDAVAPVRGLSIDIGEAGSQFGESTCRRNDEHRRARFTVPFTFREAGPHTVRLEVTAGACSALARATSISLPLVVLPAGTPRAATRATTPDSAAASAHCPNADVVPGPATLRAVRNGALCVLNAARRADGRSKLRMNRRLERIATSHSRDMVNRWYFDHTEPPDITLLQRLRVIRWSADAGENLGYAGPPLATARSMTLAWLQSSGHRSNMLDRAFRYVGIGVWLGAPQPPGSAGATYTTDFGGPRLRR